MDIRLSPEAEKQLLKAPKIVQDTVYRKILVLQKNQCIGQKISRKLIPQHYHVRCLFRLQLVQAWRLLYTIDTRGVGVLFIGSHKEYSRLFKY